MVGNPAESGSPASTDDTSSAADALDVTTTPQNLSVKQVKRHRVELGLPAEVEANLTEAMDADQPGDGPGSAPDSER
jgi:hypothetical protein